MTLRDLAHARAGDKGNISNIGVFAFRQEDYAALANYLTPEVVAAHLAGIVKGRVVRYDLPKLSAFNFVLYDALGGGVTRSLALDAHGKCLSSILLELELPADLISARGNA